MRKFIVMFVRLVFARIVLTVLNGWSYAVPC